MQNIFIKLTANLANFTAEDTCPAKFRSRVNTDTQFFLPSEFNYTKSSPINTKDEISVCCKSSQAVPNLIALIALALLGLYIALFEVQY